MLSLIRILFLFSVLFFAVSESISLAQASNIKFKHYNVENGLSQNNVNCIIQDKKGYMWFGTEDGLNQFNGYTFTIFKNNLKDTTSISSNLIRVIYEDTNGRIWVGTRNGGLNLFDRTKNSFVRYTNNKHNPQSIAGDNIAHIFEDSKGTIWIATELNGISRLEITKNGVIHFVNHNQQQNFRTKTFNEITVIFEDSKRRLWIGSRDSGLGLLVCNNDGSYKIVQFPLKKNKHGANSNYSITYIYEDKDGILWVGTFESGLIVINTEKADNDSVLYYVHNANDKNSISSNCIGSIFQDRQKNIWIGTWTNGLCLYNKERKNFIHFTYNEYRYNLSGTTVVKILEDNEGSLWIGTGTGGISLLRRNEKMFVNFEHDVNNENSLCNNFINCLYEDNTGNIWIGTRTGGVSLLNKFNTVFTHYKNDPFNVSSLSSDAVLSFCEDTQGHTWIGTDGGGLNLFNKNNNTFTRYQHHENIKNTISKNVILSILKDSKNNLWFGTWSGGISMLDNNRQSFLRYLYSTNDSGSISSPNVWSIFEDSRGALWFGTCCSGLNLFNPITKKFSRYNAKENDSTSLAGDCIWKIYEDKRGNLWIGTASGLSKLVRDKNNKIAFKSYKHSDNNSNSISSDWIWSVYEDNDSNLWIGTNGGGLNLFNRDKETFKAYTENDGLPNNVVYGILEDAHHNLWLSTNHGISRFNTKTKKIKNFDAENGLQNNQFNCNAYLKSGNGEMYFGGVNGFYVFHPDSIKDNQQVPPIIITDFKLFYKSVQIGGNSPLKQHISETKEIELSYKESSIAFEFAALNFIFPEKNQYACMLEGFDPTWIHLGSKRSASYTNLDPGKYTFRVKGSNNDGLWNEMGTSVIIIITPPYWQTWWFRTLLLLAVISLIIAIFYYRMKSITRMNTMLKEKVLQRTNELNLKNEILQQQSFELNDINAKLEERQQQIEEQSEELLAQREELVKQRDKFEELNNTKDKLFSILAHDLRSPFNSLLGFSDLLFRNLRTYSLEKIEIQVGHIRETAQSTFYLLNNLLDWARNQQGIIKITPQQIFIKELVDNEINLLQQQAKRKGIGLKLITNGDELPVEADPDTIATVLRNLISNAIKYSKKGQEVILNIEYQQENLCFSVTDSGIGMSPEKVGSLFNVNTNHSTKGTSGEKGTGLGLLLCADFIEKHGGTIWAESELGKGSTFFFTLPYNQSVKGSMPK